MRNKLIKYKQEHLIEYYNSLTELDKLKFEREINSIDFDLMQELFVNCNKINKTNYFKPVIPISKSDFSDITHYEGIGENVVNSGEFALITLAGGQGTRLGCNYPKGKFMLDGKSLFEYMAEKIKETNTYWLVMTSNDNHEETIDFFFENNNFGIKNVDFFTQGDLPLIDVNGKIVLDSNGIKFASSGNGDIYKSLVRSGQLKKLKEKNIKYLFVNNVDNILSNPLDYFAIGLLKEEKTPLLCKSIKKAYDSEKVGVYCYKNGNPGVVEYTEVTDKMLKCVDEDGNFLYNNANISANYLTVDLIEEISNHNLEFHAAFKKSSYLDENLKLINPIKENVFKFESFIFDGFRYAKDFIVLDSKRNEEFAPIKNSDEIGVDCPKTALELYKKNYYK